MRLKLAVLASIAAVGFLVSLGARTGLVGTAGSTADGVSGATVSEEALDHAIDIRQTLGLRSDESYVRSTFDLPIRPSMYVDIPITGAEERFISQQDAVGSSVAETEASFKSERGFGGAWFDLSSSRIMVAVTKDAADDLVARFADQVGAPNLALAVKVENTFEELWSTYMRANTLAASNPDGALRSVSLDVIGNAVKLGVRPPTPAAERAELVAALGPGAKVVDHEEAVLLSLPRPG